jgi:hypothetical protein
MAHAHPRGFAAAGLVTGPAAWGISTQLNYALVPWVCASGWRVIPIATLILVALGLFGTAVSWRAWHRAPSLRSESAAAGEPAELLAILGVLSGALFSLIVLMQGSASLFLTGCE